MAIINEPQGWPEVSVLAVPVLSAMFVLLLIWISPVLLLVLILADLLIVAVLALLTLTGWRVKSGTEDATRADTNAKKIREYLGKMAHVRDSSRSWGAGGAQIVEVKNNVLALLMPSEPSGSTPQVVLIHCDEVQIDERSLASCAVQIRVLAHHLNTMSVGDICNWGDREMRHVAPRARGRVTFRAEFNRVGTLERRQIIIYAPTEANPEYTLVAVVDGKEDSPLYGNNVDISKKFAIIQIEYCAQGFRYVGGEKLESPDPLFVLTN